MNEGSKKIRVAIDLDGVLASRISALLTFIKPTKGSLESIERLSTKYDLVIVTARYPLFIKNTRKWIEKNFPNKFSKVYFTRYITPFGPKVPKSKVCLKEGVSIIVDDKLSNTLDCYKNQIASYLFGAKFDNRKVPTGIIKVSTWDDVLDKLL